jgi:integrase
VEPDETGNWAASQFWLTEYGSPMSCQAWDDIFERASARCLSFGYDIQLTPHGLRHTYAVHMLSELIKLAVPRLGETGVDYQGGRSAYLRVHWDPLDQLRRLLGHSSITTTFLYLDFLDGARDLVESASENWARLAVLPPTK